MVHALIVLQKMIRSPLIAIALLFLSVHAHATSTIPFKGSKITIEFPHGRKAVFTLNQASRYETPQIIGVQFVFSNGKTADVPQGELNGIKLIDVLNTEIETLVEEGSWALTVRIENQRKIPNRVADDWVVFIFKDYKYTSKWLELNEDRNAPNKKAAEQAGTGQPATRPESKSEGGDKPQPEAEGRSR